MNKRRIARRDPADLLAPAELFAEVDAECGLGDDLMGKEGMAGWKRPQRASRNSRSSRLAGSWALCRDAGAYSRTRRVTSGSAVI